MEFKPIMPEATAAGYSSGSSPSLSSSSPSSLYSEDSDNEAAPVRANSITAREGGDSEADSENGGFASGLEEFETAPEIQFAAGTGGAASEETAVGEGGAAVTPGAFRPVAKVSKDDDDDDVVDDEDEGGVGGSSPKVLVGELDGAEGVLVDKTLSSEAVASSPPASTDVDKAKEEENPALPRDAGDGTGDNSLISESSQADAEVEGTNFTAGGDTIVEAMKVDASASGAAVVGDVVNGKDPNIVESDIPVEKIVSLDNGFTPIRQSSQGSYEVVNFTNEKLSEVEVMKFTVEGDTIVEATQVDVLGPGAAAESDATSVSADDKSIDESVKVTHTLREDQDDAAEDVTETQPLHEMKAPESNGTIVEAQEHDVEDGIPSEIDSDKRDVEVDSEDGQKLQLDEDTGAEGSESDGEKEALLFENSEAAQQFLDELERGLGGGSQSGAESSQGSSQHIDGQIVTDSDEEVDTDEEGDGKELFDSAALAALLKAATGADNSGGNITITSQDGSRLFSVERPAGLGSSLRSVKPAPRPNRPSLFSSSLTPSGESESNLSEEEKKKLEKIQEIRVKFLRLVQRLGYSPEDSLAVQVLHRLALVGGRQPSQLSGPESAKRRAAELELEGKDDLGFSLNVLVLGKAGVGKSATINSILGEDKAQIHAFETATTEVKEIVGTVHGVKIRFFDTPALKPSIMEQNTNRKILSNIKKFTKKCPPDIVLYVDRLDTQTRDLNDLPLLKTITGSLGSSIWKSAVVTLTHAASAPPDGPSGSPLNYDAFVTQRSHVVQQSIGQAVGDLRLMNPSLMNPVSLVENHPSCRKNREGEKILPNGLVWRPQLLLLSFSMKILSEASSLSKPQDPFDHRKLFGFRVRSPPLPYLLSWLLQSRTHPKLASDQEIENGDSDVDLADLSESDEEDGEDEYDQLPPFKPLRKAQLAKLSKDQRRAYLEEYDYRVKLLQKKQWREELKRMKEMKKKGKVATDEYPDMGEDADADGTPAAVPVPLHDMVLPPSFDSENPAYRYRFLEPTSQFIARPVLDTHGWDHDCGYDGVNLEHSLAIASKFPTAVAVQITKDKKEFNIHLDSSVAAKYGESGSAMAGFDIQNIGKQLAYIVRGETKFKSFRKNKSAVGGSVTFLGENVAAGFKVEDQITVGKRVVLVGSAGTVRSQGDSVYGANLEVRLREADFPIGQDQSSLGVSLVRWRGDLALGANLQSQFSVGRSSKIAVRAGLNNKMSGQITVRTSSSEQLQLALVAILPIATAIYRRLWPGASDNYAIY